MFIGDLILLTTVVFYGFALRTRKDYVRIVFIWMSVHLLMQAYFIYQNRNGLPSYRYLYQFFAAIEYPLLGLLYSRIITNRSVQKSIQVSIPAFLLLCIIFGMTIMKDSAENFYTMMISSFLLLCLSLVYLRQLFLYGPQTQLYRYPLFWISTGILILSSADLIVSDFPEHLVKSPELLRILYQWDDIFSYTFLLFILAGGIAEVATLPKKNTGRP
jgi:hypothetical protein